MSHNITLNNGISMPMLGLGTYQMRGSEAYQPTITALKLGYRSIDTASIYRNEEEVGRAIRDSGVPRLYPHTTSYIFSFSFTVTHLDLYLIHWPGVSGMLKESPEQVEIRTQSWLALEKLYKEGIPSSSSSRVTSAGRCRSIGVSNFGVEHLKALIADPRTSVVPAVNQVELHPLLTQEELRSYSREVGIVTEAYASLVRGEVWDNSIIKEISSSTGKTSAQVLLRWAVQRGLVVIPKSSTEERIRENGDIFDFELKEEEMNQLDSLNKDYHCCWDPTGVP
ncbi:hypothetical protein PROFUN_11777 [Planoprotostelium fungivorum]|uniref:NADP-dependent oxidoreductase domain-containing protein n=1 Tax=Planoprotostelium fungivorum TaxID=1890364 RepID=A0A2P6N8M3_9EUKA|nr:hypothetical protein PROFUN_11777 [Planoprotostelium fungivorum]